MSTLFTCNQADCSNCRGLPSAATPAGQADPYANLPEPRSLKGLVEILHTELQIDKECVDPERIRRIMESYKSNPDDWTQYAFLDRSKAYTRNLIDDGNGRFNLMLLCWSEGQRSAIHDHAGSHCLMKVMDGQIVETQFEWPEGDVDVSCPHSMQLKQKALYSRDQVAYIHDKIGLHRVSNPSNDAPAISLHLYSPPYDMCKTFCEETGQSRGSGRCLFYSKGGKRCDRGLIESRALQTSSPLLPRRPESPCVVGSESDRPASPMRPPSLSAQRQPLCNANRGCHPPRNSRIGGGPQQANAPAIACLGCGCKMHDSNHTGSLQRPGPSLPHASPPKHRAALLMQAPATACRTHPHQKTQDSA
ncbi:RmlC-like cupin domain-containing protein [Polychytrium aggregatum]|uniref:RmlC-like cupin domain-containing protein n=1 Tax=Polychytrium aggregatum TaxID=110093 RepID=UPI0022FEA084|nr:RmlC-like cupin domain-containing protein [Polychytrium aggregatum]KAI9203640.1 RmlC-like cupin domain-containing protein [Polychytrium aggregatum]